MSRNKALKFYAEAQDLSKQERYSITYSKDLEKNLVTKALLRDHDGMHEISDLLIAQVEFRETLRRQKEFRYQKVRELGFEPYELGEEYRKMLRKKERVTV